MRNETLLRTHSHLFFLKKTAEGMGKALPIKVKSTMITPNEGMVTKSFIFWCQPFCTHFGNFIPLELSKHETNGLLLCTGMLRRSWLLTVVYLFKPNQNKPRTKHLLPGPKTMMTPKNGMVTISFIPWFQHFLVT